jgi:hypothetical protein
MGKLLRGLVIVLFLASIGALVMAHILFSRREVLRGRVRTLERAILSLAPTIESNQAEAPAVRPNFPERDLSPATAQPEPSPRRGQFWTNYQIELEADEQQVLNFTPRRRELMSYYRLDALGKPLLDPVTGVPFVDGAGTMQGLLDELIARAIDQSNLLSATRRQLRSVREELIDTINEFNQTKIDLRTEKATVVRVEGEREEQRRLKEETQRQLNQANEQIRELDIRISELEQDKLVLMEEKDTLQARNDEMVALIARLRQEIEDLKKFYAGTADPTRDISAGVVWIDIEVGEKGSVVSVDENHLFVVMQMDPAFMDALIKSSVAGRLPNVDLYVERDDGPGRRFIAKVRLIQIKQDRNLAIGDVLPDWLQEEIRVGDRVYYQ